MTTAVEVRTPNALTQHLRAVKPYLDRLLPDPARFGAMLLVTARRNPDILKCDPASVVGAALACAQMNLEPGPADHVWLIPRRNSHTNTIDCTLMLGYKGMKALAERHPAIASVRTGTVYEHDEFAWTMQPPSLRHTPKIDGARGDEKFWYAVATRSDGDPPHIAVLDKAEVEARRAKSASKNSGPWQTHYDAMARKSALRALWHELPSSLDMQRAAALDENVVTPQDLGVPAADAKPREITGRLVDEDTGEILVEGSDPETPPPAEDDDDQPIDVGETGRAVRPDGPSATGEGGKAVAHGGAPDQTSSASQVQSGGGLSSSAPATSAQPLAADARPADAGDLTAVAPAPVGPPFITQKQIETLAHLFDELGKHTQARMDILGVRTGDEIKKVHRDHADALIRRLGSRAESWRANRQSRLESNCLSYGIDLGALLTEHGYSDLSALTAAQAQVLIDVTDERAGNRAPDKTLPGEEGSTDEPDAGAPPDAELADARAEFLSALDNKFATNRARSRTLWCNQHFSALNVADHTECSASQLRQLIDELNGKAASDW